MCPRTQVLFEKDLVIVYSRVAIYYGAFGVGNLFWGYLVVKLRSFREVLMVGFFIYLIGSILFCTIQPGQNANLMAFAAVTGFGLGSILSQVTAGVQLVSPHAHLATATAVALIIRAVATATFVPIYSSVVKQSLSHKITAYIGEVAIKAGLNTDAITAFIEGISIQESSTALLNIPGTSQAVISNGVHAFQQANADAVRLAFIIAVPFVLLATILCWWLSDLRNDMNYHVDAPVELLTAKADTNLDQGRGKSVA